MLLVKKICVKKGIGHSSHSLMLFYGSPHPDASTRSSKVDVTQHGNKNYEQ